jgi:hypothetical protein
MNIPHEEKMIIAKDITKNGLKMYCISQILHPTSPK